MTEEIVTCPGCGNEIGRYYVIKGQEFLHIGGILSREVHGVCIQCGKEFHWSVRDRDMERLIRKKL